MKYKRPQAAILAISNNKGGVGKTTSTVNLGAALAVKYGRVLLIDADPQANLTLSLGADANSSPNLYTAIHQGSIESPIKIKEGLDLVPSHLDLTAAELELTAEPGREYILKELLKPWGDSYNYILIDTPPSLGLLTINALTAANQVYIPLQAEFLAVQGLNKLLNVINKIEKRINPKLQLGGIFLTMYSERRALNRDIKEGITETLQGAVLDSKISDNIALAEAATKGQDIFTYKPKSKGAQDYLALAEEIYKLTKLITP
jgi:chromosome partitioning protein